MLRNESVNDLYTVSPCEMIQYIQCIILNNRSSTFNLFIIINKYFILDIGGGKGIVRTLMPLDREERSQILVPLIVSDAGTPSMTATATLTLNVADVNDNLMFPATKHIQVHTLQVSTY